MAPATSFRFLIASCMAAVMFTVARGQFDDFGLVESRPGNGREPSLIDDFGPFIPPAPTRPKPPVAGSCNSTIYENEGRIASPGFPSSAYPSGANCSWLIRVDPGKLIKLQFEYMDIEVGPPECPFDGVLILDYGVMWETGITPRQAGPVATGVRDPQIPPTVLGTQRFCGQDLHKPLESISNAVRVEFYSDSGDEQNGFVLSWTAVDMPKQYSCNFDNGMCPGWFNVDGLEDNFDWEIGSGETTTKNTGPDEDRTPTTNDGQYAYIEASKPRIENDTAILSSPEIELNEGVDTMCIEFWYHMYGEHIGSLVMGLAVAGDKNVKWLKSGDQGNFWQRAAVNVTALEIGGSVTPFRVMFAAVRGKGYEGDMAIDDVTIFQRPCGDEADEPIIEPPTMDYSTLCTSPQYPCMVSNECIDDEKLCDGVTDCPEGDDESDILCAFNFTTDITPPLFTQEDTTAYPTMEVTEEYSTEMMTTGMVTSYPAWTTDVTSFTTDVTTNDFAESTTVRDATTTDITTEVTTTEEKTTESDDQTTAVVATTEPGLETTKQSTTATTEPPTTKTVTPRTTTQPAATTSSEVTSQKVETTLDPESTTAGTTEEASTPEPEVTPATTKVYPEPEPSSTKAAVKVTPEPESSAHTTVVAPTITKKRVSETPEATSVRTTTATTVTTTPEKISGGKDKPKPAKPFTPRPSAKPENGVITAKAVEPTAVAEKQEGGDGSAAKLSGLSVIYICLATILVQWLWSGR